MERGEKVELTCKWRPRTGEEKKQYRSNIRRGDSCQYCRTDENIEPQFKKLSECHKEMSQSKPWLANTIVTGLKTEDKKKKQEVGGTSS